MPQDTRVQSQAAQDLYDMSPSADKTLKLIPTGCHQLLQETLENKATVFASIREWLDKRS